MPDTDEPVIVTAKLTKVFRDFWLREKVTAVADLDLKVMPKEVFGLLGPNGSGKSTTLKMILGLMFPTRGWITVFGRRATDVRIKSRIGFLPEETYLYPFLDARETLDYYGRLFHQPRRQRTRRIGMLLDMVGLSSVAYRRIGEYSKGMKRLIGMAQALINDPDLLILDEPTSGMDPIATRRFKDLIQLLAQRGKTVVLASHLLGDVEDVCNRVCVLYGGRKRALGQVDELLAQHTLTQITTEQLDEKTLGKVRRVLAEAGRALKEVTAPRDKLESLFLRIVSEAQAGRVATGGVGAAGEVPDFLRSAPADQGRAVIQQLVAATEQAEPQPAAQVLEVQAEPAPPDRQARPEVLESLMEAPRAPRRGAKDADQPPAAPKQPERQGDRTVIDGLLGDSKPADGDC
ncbi:MAG: ATP-binding cassette domain-containing protein [Phycisphaerae bacterium]|nr:ATP-binding cassette domain-containing protein [Phycisphaerae bacterium]